MKRNYFLQIVIVFLFTVATASAQDYTTLLKENLLQTRAADGLTQQDVEELTIYNQSTSRTSGVEHVYAVQNFNGIEIFNANVAAAFRGEELVHVGDNLQLGIADRIIGTTPVLSPVQAATTAATTLGAGTSNFSVLETISSQEVVLNQGGVSFDNVPVKLVYQLTDDSNEFRLAWDLSIHMVNQPHWYSVRVDAVSGEILSQHDWIVSCSFDTHNHNAIASSKKNTISSSSSFGFKNETATAALAGEQYNVFPAPVESPAHGANQLVVDPQNLDASPFGWHDTNGAAGAEFTITRGNNVWAQDDINGNNGVGASPDGGADLNFDFEYDFVSDPINMLDAVTTNLFYWNNIIHDVMYQYGFDEVSGNFQEFNYSGEGTGSDSVNADAQDGSGTNNATFGTPPEGNNPRMSMFLWGAASTPTFDVNAPAELAGTYGISSAAFGPSFPIDGLTGDLALVQDDDSGASTDPTDACDTITNASDLEGKIAVVRRGECTFVIKVQAAQDAGALGVLVVNNVPTPIINLGGNDGNITIPSGMVSQADGEALIAALENGGDINVTIAAPAPTIKDGSLDNGIIVHEYGHGISTRLTGGPNNSGCLGGAEQMGEGWSDWYGLMFTLEPGDLATDIRGIATYATSSPITSQGIRPAAYSTDFAINDLTYDDTNNTAAISEPHGIGTVWSTMLWDMTWFLIDEYGFDSDLYNGTGGNNIALQLVTDGLKLQPCNPGFVTGRNAILAAIQINTTIPDEDKDEITCGVWGVFANRGLGVSASQGSVFSRTDQVEAFDTPSETDETSPCFDALSTDGFVENNFSIFPNPSNGQININMTSNLGEGQVQIVDLNGRVVFSQDMTLEGTLNVDASGLARGVYLVQVANQTVSETAKLIIR